MHGKCVDALHLVSTSITLLMRLGCFFKPILNLPRHDYTINYKLAGLQLKAHRLVVLLRRPRRNNCFPCLGARHFFQTPPSNIFQILSENTQYLWLGLEVPVVRRSSQAQTLFGVDSINRMGEPNKLMNNGKLSPLEKTNIQAKRGK